MLTEAYPDCRIILTTPTFCSYYEDGSEMQSEQGGKLADYVNAVIQTASELGVECMDNYSKLGIEASNYTDYLSDGCHPNEAGRYLIGIKILMYLQH
jgi:lysophospholipase L1-like esterase